ncbi:MAG TPA: DMT family transporter [Oligoflexus sp.]|uniref:DMT family transporter n=1 Tax=Oligoflexus sp. TaxID=1971216 RepID=UPI002D726CBC|nr:DMT family transporter [Oligoflexus sp.]HYX38126.1 DMT family transporter [Oligoflexus sp.]
MPLASGQLLGEAASLAAAMIWACSLSLYSRYGRQVPSSGLNLYKNIVALACLLVTGLIIGFELPADGLTMGALAVSGLIGLALGDTLFFHGIKTIGVQRSSVIQCLAPPLAAVISWLVFAETLSRWEWLGLLVTTGALAWLMASRNESVDPTVQLDWTGVAAAIGSAVCQASAVIILRQALQGGDVVTGTILRVLPAMLVLTVISYRRSGWEPMKLVFTPTRNGLILTLGAFMGTYLGLILMSTGAKYAKAGVTAAISSTYPVWILPIAHYLLGERVSWKSVALTLLAVAGIAIMMIGDS